MNSLALLLFHSTGLVVAIMLAKRRKHEELADSHHNLPLMFVGTA